MKKIVASLILLGSFSMATAEPLNPTPEPLDQNTMHKILRSFNDLKVQDFAAWENKMVDLCEGKKAQSLVYIIVINSRLQQTIQKESKKPHITQR